MDTEIQEQSAVDSKTYRSSQSGQPRTVGHLVGEVCLAVHSHQALRLIWGRRRTAEKPTISGLIAFASAVNTIWQAAESGDPYALWWLIKIENGIEECRSYLSDETIEAGSLYPDAEVLEVVMAESEQPYRVRLTFSNPYAYRAAHLLGEYDALIRTCHTLTFVGAGNPAELQAMVARAGHQIRRVFATPQGFKVCGITGEDLRQNSERIQRAVQLMGSLPEEVLYGEVFPTYAPAGARSEPVSRSIPTIESAEPKDDAVANEASCDPADEMPS